MSTIFYLLAEAEPTVEQLREEFARFESKHPVVVVSASGMPDPPVEMDR